MIRCSSFEFAADSLSPPHTHAALLFGNGGQTHTPSTDPCTSVFFPSAQCQLARTSRRTPPQSTTRELFPHRCQVEIPPPMPPPQHCFQPCFPSVHPYLPTRRSSLHSSASCPLGDLLWEVSPPSQLRRHHPTSTLTLYQKTTATSLLVPSPRRRGTNGPDAAIVRGVDVQK